MDTLKMAIVNLFSCTPARLLSATSNCTKLGTMIYNYKWGPEIFQLSNVLVLYYFFANILAIISMIRALLYIYFYRRSTIFHFHIQL